MSCRFVRRDFLKKTIAASAGAAVALSLEEKALLAKAAGAAPAARPKDSAGALPTGKIGNVAISRLICGGNLINGFAHARDLIYVSDLMKHYFSDDKIMETWEICEENGVNTMISTVNSPYANGQDPTLRVINRYRKERGGEIQWIAQCFPKEDDLLSAVTIAVDNGAVGVCVQGQVGDIWVREGRLDLLGKVVAYIKKSGLIAGVACHDLAVPKTCEKEGLGVDFCMKTLHRDDYFTATPKEQRPERGLPLNNNMWCTKPQDTIEFMKTVKKPWIAYKVLAAGAIHPRKGFQFAFANGADFACAGMFDFHITENVIIAKRILSSLKHRERPWRA